jgi:lysine 2,3-aminomutase
MNLVSLRTNFDGDADPPIVEQKPAVDPSKLDHKKLERRAFWRKIPAYADVTEKEFFDHVWQRKNSVTRAEMLFKVLHGLVSKKFVRDAAVGFQRAPMSVRVSPYVLSLIDWDHPYADPLRIQFIPLASRLLPDHPKLALDSLHEQADAPVAGLTHRYWDRALFLPLNTCPVYCRFCTRSYAVGIDTEEVEKVEMRVSEKRWRSAYRYIASRPEVEDVVVSGGDAYNLRPSQITEIGRAFLAMPNIRRMRFGTKGPAVMPQKILTDHAWTDALTRIVERGRRMHKDVALHTHFNHPREITGITQKAMNLLFERGIPVRNQTVLARGVNDSVAVMSLLVKRLAYVNIRPYYVYMHDLVKGVEDLRTTLEAALVLEKQIRGHTSGFNTPMFVVDAPGGGGKRDVHSYEHYDRQTGISVFTSPSVAPGTYYFYFDPLHRLSADVQKRWQRPNEQKAMMADALACAKGQKIPIGI